ncbi:hypothetical protein WJX72_010856 [[Myrmecia] bisecta]|uniref:CRC domain-containing protein n=1 Tax=[Myrmecia] bisecta TaxID=41462 RepID=A0AAW1PXT5_9CHLO
MHASREKPASSRALSTPVGQTVRVRRGAAEASPFSQFAKELPPLTPPRPLYDQFYNGISAGQSPAAPAIGIPGVSCGEASTSRPEREVSPEDGQSSEHAGPRLGSPDRQPSVAFGEHCSYGHLQTGITLAVPVEAAAALVASLAHTAATPVARRRSATSYSGHSIVTETSQQSVQMPETPGDAVKLGDRRDSTSATGGPKKCNCKKSKCLKLYCDCFAAGQYCTNCTCQNCCNTPDQKDIVDEMRDQIRSRNPHAFDEKIGKHYVAAGGAGQHKRGCNCKKSHCRKKYCECFQAGVNCGQHCKCEGCHNCVEHGPPPKPKEPKQKAVVEVAYHVAGVTKTSPGTPAVKAVPEAKPAERKLTRQRSKRGSVGSAGSAGRSQEDTAQEGSQPGSSAPSLLPYDTPGMVWPTSQLQQPAAHVLPTSEAAHAQDMPDAEPLPIQPLQTSRQVDVKVEPGLASQSTQMAISPQQPGMQASPCLPGDTLHTGLPPGSDHIPISSSQGMMMLPMLPSPSQGFGGGLPPAGPEMPAGPLPEQAEAYGAGAEAPPAYQVIYSQTADGQFVPVFATTGQVQQLQSGAVLVPQPGQTPGSAHLHLLTGGCQGTPSASLMLPLASPARLEASLQEADGPSAAFQLLAPSSAFFGDLMGQEFEITEVTDYAEARMVEVGLEGGDEMEIELEELMRGAPEFGDEGLAHLPFPLAMGAERGQWAGEEFENAPSAANTLHSGSPGTSTRLDRSFAGHKTGSPGTRSKAKRSIHLGSPLHSPRQENGVRRCTPTKRAARFGAYHTSALAASLAGDLASMHSGRGMSHVAPALAAGSGMDKPQLMTQHSAHFEGSGAQHAQHAVPSLGQAMDEDVFMAGAVQRGAELQRAATWEEGSTRLQHLGTGSTTIFSPNRK